MTIDPKHNTSRRSFIIKASAAYVATSFPFGAAWAQKEMLKPVRWRGAALGAEAVIELHHPDPEMARIVLANCMKEIDRLEQIFSLYREDSQLVRLNRDGFLESPDIQFLDLLSSAKAFSVKTDGLFDVTIQPLWSFYGEYYAHPTNHGKSPSAVEIQPILKRIGYKNLLLSEKRIEFKKPEMAVTLNGIAQGYITDRIKLMLQQAGFQNVLLSLGEIATIGPKVTGQPWAIGLETAPDSQYSSYKTIALEDDAVATSGAYNSPFDKKIGANHLLNPKTGAWSLLKGSVSVVADKAMTADMYSTALSLMTELERRALLSDATQVRGVYYSSTIDGENWTG
jgi:thiamine biosynthesis lipoprotein